LAFTCRSRAAAAAFTCRAASAEREQAGRAPAVAFDSPALLIRGLIAAYASLSLGYDLYAAHVQVPMGFVVLGAMTQIVGVAILGLIVRELP